MGILANVSPAVSGNQTLPAGKNVASRSTPLQSDYSSLKTFSLTRRIVAAVVTCQVLLAVGLALVAVLYAREQLRGTFNTALKDDAISTLAGVRYSENKPYVLEYNASYEAPAANPAQKNLYEIRGADGHLIVRSPGWDRVPGEVAESRENFVDFTSSGIPYRAVLLRNTPVLDSEDDDPPQENVTVIFASSLAENQRRLTKLVLSVGLTSLLLLVVANMFAISSVRRGLEPLRDLADQAGAISVHHWDFKPSSRSTLARELSPLAKAIETVLARLKESFRRQRDFSNDAAHELKTSVAILKSTLQSLLHRPRTQREYEDGLEGLLEDCGRLEDLLGRMLRLALIEQHAENGAPRSMATTELTSTCEAAIARMSTLAEQRNISMEFDSPGPVSMRADPEDLELIWINLLENAVLYSPAGSTIKIKVQRTDGAIMEVTVSDAGPGIPAQELPYIFERFHRGDPSRARSTGGFGLGLAICKALVDAYGGTIEAVNLPAHGTQMRVHLPV